MSLLGYTKLCMFCGCGTDGRVGELYEQKNPATFRSLGEQLSFSAPLHISSFFMPSVQTFRAPRRVGKRWKAAYFAYGVMIRTLAVLKCHLLSRIVILLCCRPCPFDSIFFALALSSPSFFMFCQVALPAMTNAAAFICCACAAFLSRKAPSCSTTSCSP